MLFVSWIFLNKERKKERKKKKERKEEKETLKKFVFF